MTAISSGSCASYYLVLPLFIASLFLPSLTSSSATTTTKKKINRCPLRPSHNNIDRPPLVLGHRGASFHIPEHTIPSYRLALELGADYIEPDLVPCKTGQLVAVHSVDLNITTNVHTYNNGEFRGKARQSAANNDEWGYYVHDFTWDEIQKLRVQQRVSDSGARYDGYDYMFKIPSFSQIVDLLYDWNTRELPLIGRPTKLGGVPGAYVELKRSDFFREDANISISDLFLDELTSHPKASDLLFDHVTLCDSLRYDEYRVPPLVIQSFESDVLEYLRAKFKERWMDFVEEDELLAHGVVNMTGEDNDEIDHPWIPPMVLLVRSDYCQSESFWFDMAKLHISGIGPNKACLLPSSEDIASNNTSAITHAKREAREWVAKAHSERLGVHPWTVRLELESDTHVGGVPTLFASVEDELRYYFCELNIDGVFSENIAAAEVVAAEGCDGYTSEEESNPTVGSPNGPICVEEERSLWFLGLSFLALGVFVGSTLTCFITTALTKRGYCSDGVGNNTSHAPVSSQLPDIDTTLEMEEEEDRII